VRVLVDANVYISYLLIRFGDRDPNVIVDGALAGLYVPLLVPELTAELQRKIAEKPYLSDRISPHELGELAESLRLLAEELHPLDEPPPPRGRDPKDDYLFAHAIAAAADFIVSGDNDVVAVGQVDGIRILSTAEFARMLRRLRTGGWESDRNGDHQNASDSLRRPD
jgi:putative PIN family toxin of toxin-antitoxin system